MYHKGDIYGESRIIQKVTNDGKTITYLMVDTKNNSYPNTHFYRYTELDPNNSFKVVYKKGIPQMIATPYDYRQHGYSVIQQQIGRKTRKSRNRKRKRRKTIRKGK